MRLLLTRPQPEAVQLADRLAGLGHDSLIEPLLEIEDLGVDFGAVDVADAATVQAFLVTSANGARALSRVLKGEVERLAQPVFAVGDASANAARMAGFANVVSAQGDVATLARQVAAALDPTAGALLYGHGVDSAGDLASAMRAKGFKILDKQLYRARSIEEFTLETAQALRLGDVDGVLLYSPRTAATLTRLLQQEKLAKQARSLYAFCLSPVVAGALSPLTWKKVLVAERPNQADLLAILENLSEET